MFFVELVMQGVRGFQELARVRFQSGFNIVSGGNESGKTTAIDAMQRLLFPTGQGGAVESLLSRQTPDASRGALVVCSDDGAYYRIIQDFSKHAVNLSRYNSDSKEFKLLYKDWDRTGQFLAGMTSGISEEDYARVFLFRREHYNTDRAPSPARAASAAPRPSAVRPALASGKTAASRARLAELRESLKKAEEAADADYRYQSAKLALDETKKKLASLEEMDRKKSEIEATLAELKGCDKLPEDLSGQIEVQEQRQGQKLAEMDELNKELEGLKVQLDSIPVVNLTTDKLFIAGAVFLILSILAGVFVLTDRYAHYFPVGIILSFILIAVAWYNGSRKNAQRRAIRRDTEALEEERIELEKKFVHEGASIAAYMRAVGASTMGELKEKGDNYRYFSSLLRDNEEARQRMFGDLTPEVLQQQYSKQQEETLELEQAARAVAPYAIDTYAIRQDIERLESESAPADPSWDSGDRGRDFPAGFGPPLAGSGQDGFLAELGIASRIGGIEMETLTPAVEAAAQRNLSAITTGRYVRIEVGHDGPPVVHAKDDLVVSFAELSHGTKALIYFCFRTGLVEALVGKRRLPFVLDDALAGFDPVRQQAACHILRTLGTKTQVVLFTSNPALRAAGDVSVEFK
ncbi:MAG: ATP-binding protein [Betaproteobacteria bacterium]